MPRKIALGVICIVCAGIALISVTQSMIIVLATEETVTPMPTSFPDPIGIHQLFACPDRIVKGDGPTWLGIEVGVSELEDLQGAWTDVYNPEKGVKIISETAASQYIRYGEGAVCVQDNVVVTLRSGDKLPYLIDYIAAHGEPDAITWTPTYNYRIAFWFEEGFAVEILTSTTDRTSSSWGSTSTGRIFYFPYQAVEGFEQRWPYNATQREMPSLLGIGDIVPTEQNPFDFDAMIATITAQPSRTPTAIFTPIQTATGTPTPTITPTLRP